jgi:hypothetical protein
MFAKHAFTECSKLFPLVTTILTSAVSINAGTMTYILTYYELLVANGHREVTIERHTEIVRVIALSIDDMFQ